MRDLKGLLHWNRGPGLYATGLDLGDGRTMPPEDVLDGHSARLLAGRRSGARTVPVQVDDNLSAAITVMAPNLAPLADLAEQVAVAVPAVQPEPDFRRNLYAALERTHRQYLTQEALGTRPPHDRGGHPIATAMLAAAAVACIAGLLAWLTLRRTGKAHPRPAGFPLPPRGNDNPERG